MPIYAASYLMRTPRRGCYYFRMKVPLDLQQCIGKKELRASLRTGYTGEAHFKARVIAGKVQQLFRKIRLNVGDNYDMTELDRTKINDIIRSYIKGCLDGDEEARINRKRPFTEDELDDKNDALSLLKSEFREDLAKCEYHYAQQTVDGLIEKHGLQIEKKSGDYNRLCHEVLKVDVDVLEVIQQRNLERYDSPEEVALRKLSVPSPALIANQGQGTASQQTSDTMKQAGEDFWEEAHLNWKPRSAVIFTALV